MSTYRSQIVVLVCLLLVHTANAQDSSPTPLPTFPLDDLVGIPIEGNINDTTPQIEYSFSGNAGVSVRITMRATSGNLNPLLILLTPGGGELARNDDAEQGTRDAAIELFLPTDGIYTIQATRLGQQLGNTSGTYALQLEFVGEETTPGSIDPLDIAPSTLFSVPFTRLTNQNFGTGQLNADNPRAYFAIGGSQGDLLRVFLTITEGDVVPQINILSPTNDLAPIGESTRPREGEVIAFATLPERNWYLVEVLGTTGSGAFTLFVEQLAVPQVAYNTVRSDDSFAINAPSAAYTFEGTIGDLIFASVNVFEGDASPEIRLLDIAQREIASAPIVENSDPNRRGVSLQALLPRSGTYILQVNNLNPGEDGTFSLRLNAIERPVDERFNLLPAEYNNAYDGFISDEAPQDVYQFTGNEGEIVTAQMEAGDTSLDPFLLLLDENLNEIAFNDNTTGTRNATISQLALPADGTYYLVAGRSGLLLGNTSGGYVLTLTAGEIDLQPGIITATLNWNGDDDLNLFVREPSGRVISWSNPESPLGGELQIDSNTNCIINSSQPVEHIYWEPDEFPPSGDYELWVWYQNVCGLEEPTEFSFQLMVNDAVEIDVPRQRLEVGERFNMDIRVSGPQVFVLDPGRVTQPSPQQRASEGGDVPILYGQTLNSSISDEVYARFYQFEGEEGDNVVIEATTLTGNLDPILVLRDDSENNLTQSDDISRENRNARIEYELPYTGRYVIAVTRFGVREGLTFGDFRLSLNAGGY